MSNVREHALYRALYIFLISFFFFKTIVGIFSTLSTLVIIIVVKVLRINKLGCVDFKILLTQLCRLSYTNQKKEIYF